MHYAHRMKAQIKHLERVNSKYYDAIYDAKGSAGLDPGVYFGGNRLFSHEECLRLNDPEVLRKIIEDLPCPVIIEEIN